MAAPPHSRLGRLARIGRMTGRVGGSYLQHAVRSLVTGKDDGSSAHADAAMRVAEALGELKGAAMKVGQAVAMGLEGMDVPADVRAALQRMNDRGEPVPFAQIKASVEAELDKPLDLAFLEFDPSPLGTASLGQAHAARLPDGAGVVVKVLHSGIDGSVGADLSALKAVLLSSRILRRDRAEVDAWFDEIRERIEEELDYVREAENLDFFRRALASDRGLRVPRTYPGWSTRRVLTMERLFGEPIDRFIATADPAVQQRAGLSVARSFHRMLYDLATLHADPHPGNTLFAPDGTLGLLDFGCVKRFERPFVAAYAGMALAVIDRRRPEALAYAERLGILAPGWRPEAGDLLWELADAMCDPFRRGPYTAGSGEDNVIARVKAQSAAVLMYPELRSPRELIFLHRALGGMYTMVRRLRTRADWGAMLRPWLEGAVNRV